MFLKIAFIKYYISSLKAKCHENDNLFYCYVLELLIVTLTLTKTKGYILNYYAECPAGLSALNGTYFFIFQNKSVSWDDT